MDKGADRIIYPPSKYPFFVKVYAAYPDGRKIWSLCGGAIINSNTVVTATYCMWKSSEMRFERTYLLLVTSGDYSYALNDTKHSRQIHYVKNIHYETKFRGYLQDGVNVAFIILNAAIEFDDYRKPIDLCTEGKVKDITKYNHQYTFVGVGDTDENEQHSTTLKAMILTEVDCKLTDMTWLKWLVHYRGPKENLMCFDASKQCSYKGDRGSPVTLHSTSSDQSCLAGISIHHNLKCFQPEGKFVSGKIQYYQGKTFNGKIEEDADDQNYPIEIKGNRLVKKKVPPPKQKDELSVERPMFKPEMLPKLPTVQRRSI
ncbi:clotting factor G beta subunit-like [Convolutriloba macropyga]|uniref:clotting factor G beta subunit-like n=1 Tax=Convolutriloba macropyga TaxID=536237 RepID=UPI003F51B821